MITGQNAGDVYPYDYEEVDIGASVTTLTKAKIDASDSALMRLESGPVRYRVDGADPTTLVGWPGYDGNILQLTSQEMIKFRAIRTGSVNGKARVFYYRSQCR